MPHDLKQLRINLERSMERAARRFFPHDDVRVNIDMDTGNVTHVHTTHQINTQAQAQRDGEIAGFICGLLKAATHLTNRDLQATRLSPTPDKPAPKLPD